MGWLGVALVVEVARWGEDAEPLIDKGIYSEFVEVGKGQGGLIGKVFEVGMTRVGVADIGAAALGHGEGVLLFVF